MRDHLAFGLCAILVLGCTGAGAGEKEGVLVEGATSASFNPTGEMYVSTHGMHLAIRRIGDDRTYLLTASPPVEKEANEEPQEEAPAAAEECVAVDPDAPLPGPQGGWHGQPAWSPDGRFIAFMAPWENRNCEQEDDADWDIWIVDVEGLELDTWVRTVTPDEKRPERKDHYIVGPGGAGLSFYQVSNAPGTEQRPAWATCRSLAWSTGSGIVIRDISDIPGACEKTRAELDEEREARIEKLETQLAALREEVAALESRVASLPRPGEEEAGGEGTAAAGAE